MDEFTFDSTDHLIEEIAVLVDQTLTSDQLGALRDRLSQLDKAIGNRYSVKFSVKLEIVDEERDATLPVLNTGLSISEDGVAFQTWGDALPQRYVVDGQVQVVPNDRCPKCWEVWDSKCVHLGCPNCDATLGGNCKILLDSGICPKCELGTVTVDEPKCAQCGFEAAPEIVVWACSNSTIPSPEWEP
jgi:hypothetical protein